MCHHFTTYLTIIIKDYNEANDNVHLVDVAVPAMLSSVMNQ